MPVAGRKPKPEGQARNRTKPTHDWLEVVDEPFRGSRPDLPEQRATSTPYGIQQIDLQPMTRTWWASTSSMPHCVLWTDADWSFALATALVADAAFSGGVGAATELRNREKVLGTTIDYRRDLRIRYVDASRPATEDQHADVVTLSDYRDL